MNEESSLAANAATVEYDVSVPPARGSAVSESRPASAVETPADASRCERPAHPASRLPDVVTLTRELREAVSNYHTAHEIDLAIENAKLLSGLAPLPSDRALCLQRLLALHDRRRALRL